MTEEYGSMNIPAVTSTPAEAPMAPVSSRSHPHPSGEMPTNPEAKSPTRYPTASPSRRPPRRRFGAGAKVGIASAAVVLLVAGGVVAYQVATKAFTGPRNDLVWHVVAYEPLPMTIVERGALESANNQDVVCRVKAGAKGSTIATTIKWLVEDGSPVRRGQLLIELDDSGLHEQLKQQRITVDEKQSLWLQAEENYKIVVSENTSLIETAKVNLKLAELRFEKYLEGDYPQLLKDVQGRIKTAESDRDQQLERSAWAERQQKKGYYTPNQAQAEALRLQALDIKLKQIQEEMRVLTEYTKKQEETRLRSELDEARRALDRVEKQAHAKEVQASTDRQTKRSIYLAEKSKAEEIEEEINKCRITAPQDGMVVYFVPEQTRWGSGSRQSIVAQGEPVGEGQRLMRIPDLRHMVVNTKVHEAAVSRVKGEVWRPTGFGDSVRAGLLINFDPLSTLVSQHAFFEADDQFREHEQRLIYPGQKAKIRCEAFPDRILDGHVKSVGTVAAKMDWSSADVKTYQTMVSIDEEVDGLKPDMGAEVTIFLDNQVERALTVPLQAIFGAAELGKKRKVFVRNSEGQPEEREIEVGLSNDKMAEIRSGLQEGDEVVINPRALVGDKVKTRQVNGSEWGGPGPYGRGGAEGGRPDGMRGPGGRPAAGETPGTDDKGESSPGQRPGAPGGRRSGGPRPDATADKPDSSPKTN
jgi:multidrug efflux pump subunit AcrA (membrane-fusion protein)